MAKVESIQTAMLLEQNKNLQHLLNVRKMEIADEQEKARRLNEELNKRISFSKERKNALKKVCFIFLFGNFECCWFFF
jgi:cell division protein FtsX